MRSLAAAVPGVVSGGSFLSVWSFGATLALSVTVMVPPGIAPAPGSAPTAATWLSFAAGLTIIAVAERRAHGARPRSIAVILGVILCAALRPVVQDAWTRAFALPTPPAAQLPFRIATNVLVWAAVLLVVALLVATLRSLRDTNTLLRTVAADLAQSGARARAFEMMAQRAVETAASDLRAAVTGLPDSGADGVRRLAADHLRPWSHRLQSLAEQSVAVDDSDAPGVSPRGGAFAIRRRWRVPFRLPPIGAVTILYTASVLPYALRSAELAALASGAAVVLGGGALADLLPRRRTFARSRRRANTAFVTASVAVGVALSLVRSAQGAAAPAAAISAVAYIGFAVAAAAVAGGLHQLRREQRRLSGAVNGAQRSARDGTRAARDGLRSVAELLHRDGQGACVILLLSHPAPTGDQLTALRERIDELRERMPRAFDPARHEGSRAPASVMATANPDEDTDGTMAALLTTWARVMDLRVDIAPAARSALHRSTWAARDAYDVVAEGLLNTAKHATQRRAEVSLDVIATGAGPHLRVRVRSFGHVSATAHLRPASHVRELGAHLRPGEVGDAGDAGAVLEAVFALPPMDAVVSPEHPARPAQRRP